MMGDAESLSIPYCMATIWDLDFYSRPLLDDQQKKVWEALICETPQSLEQNDGVLFRYSQLCPSSSVNSLWLKQALEDALAQSGQRPQKVRFFRRQMNNMITKACEEAGLVAVPSRRTYELERWLHNRLKDFYPQQAGYDPQLAQAGAVQYPELNAVELPDAARGDRGDRWALVSLELGAFADWPEWEIGFGETLPLFGRGLAPEVRIPGLILFSPRALAFAAWLSGLELGYLTLQTEPRPFLSLETGASDRWILANLTDEQTLAEAQGFERAKQQSQGVHFLALQTSPETEAFAGFWLLQSGAVPG
jgi:hypothetical protein